ncbi:MAG: hypothetical protein LBO21_01460 [Synergistaceae bacterium]|jgi:hypothetical protein|nr:hypothetical protein [Synergistaceae bacterium]
MPKGGNFLPDNKQRSKTDILTKAIGLAPLLEVLIRILELALKIFRIIN